MRRPLLAAAVALSALLASGCGGGDKTLSKEELAKQIQTGYARGGYTAPVKSVVCPDDLDAKVGKSEKCALTYRSGHVLEITATIKSVSGGKAHLGFVVTKRLK